MSERALNNIPRRNPAGNIVIYPGLNETKNKPAGLFLFRNQSAPFQ